MASIPIEQIATVGTRSRPERRYDHVFFSCLAWLMLATVFVGFAPSYYLAGKLLVPFPSLIIHVHAVIFSLWIVLLIAQTSLTTAGRVSVHRRLGVAGFILALLMPAVGIWAATGVLARGRAAMEIYLVATMNVVAFGALILFAFRARHNSGAHKRLIIIASTALMTAPIARWRFDWSHLGREIHMSTQTAECLSYIFILLLVTYDLWATRRIHRASMWGSAFLVAIQQFALHFGKTAIWNSFAGWLQSLAQR